MSTTQFIDAKENAKYSNYLSSYVKKHHGSKHDESKMQGLFKDYLAQINSGTFNPNLSTKGMSKEQLWAYDYAKRVLKEEEKKHKTKYKQVPPPPTPAPEPSKAPKTESNQQTQDSKESKRKSSSKHTQTNFKLPNWDYNGYAQELRLFRKGLTSAVGETGWFYFKIIFHFDETFGLLGNIVHNATTSKYQGNTAIQYLNTRKKLFKDDNLGARAIALEKFVKYLSYINSSTPWFFDKISGLNTVTPQINEFSKEKKIEINCLPDAIDMRLTTLFHLYQFACFDEINMKEIIPENLRKFNMTIIIYHIPIKYQSTNLNTGNKAKSLQDSGNFSNRMSYKMFTFKGCQFDLQSLSGVIPGSLDNSQPFNLGTSAIGIHYDRAFTHLMNEWEQFMVGADGFYYDRSKGIGKDSTDKFNARLSSLISANDGNNMQLIDGLVSRAAISFTEKNKLIGNIYDLDMRTYKEINLYENTSHVFYSNIFDYNVLQFKSLILAKSTIPGRYLPFENTGMGVTAFPNSNSLAQMFNIGTTYRLYNIANSSIARNYISTFDLLVNNKYQSNQLYASNYNITPYRMSLAGIATTYKNAWDNLKIIGANTKNNFKNMFKNIF